MRRKLHISLRERRFVNDFRLSTITKFDGQLSIYPRTNWARRDCRVFSGVWARRVEREIARAMDVVERLSLKKSIGSSAITRVLRRLSDPTSVAFPPNKQSIIISNSVKMPNDRIPNGSHGIYEIPCLGTYIGQTNRRVHKEWTSIVIVQYMYIYLYGCHLFLLLIADYQRWPLY